MDRKKNRIGWHTQVLGIAFLVLTSCGAAQQNNNEQKEASSAKQSQIDSIVVPDETIQAPVAEETASIVLNPPHGEPGHRCEVPVGTPLNEPSAAAKETPAPIVLNPPHGEPGHRCEIPVGSPLNGPATGETTNTPSASVKAPNSYNSMAPTVENAKRMNATRSSQAPAPTTGEKPKLNPPHGQPWHRCDITVGSPLP